MEIYEKKEKQYGPRRVDLIRTMINFIVVFASGFIGSIILFAFLFLLSSSFGYDFSGEGIGKSGFKEDFLLPFLLSLSVFFATTITMILTYYVFTITHNNTYKKNITSFFHIIFLSTIIFIFIIPIYLSMGSSNYENIFSIFVLHGIISFLLFNIILELLNNYTHILLGIYSSFLGTLITIFFVLLFGLLGYSNGKFTLIIFLIPTISALIYISKQLIGFIYYNYFLYTGNDPIGNVFYQIEKEEQED